MANWAIIVGINVYPDASGQPALQGAVSDACDFAEWALDPAGGNVPTANLYFWVHPWPDQVGALLAAHLADAPPEWDHDDLDRAPVDRNRPPKAQEIVRTAERKGRELNEAAFGQPNPESQRILVFLAGHGLRAKERGDGELQTCFVARDFRPQDSQTAYGLIPCTSFRRSLRHKRFDEVVMFLDCCRNDYIGSSTMEALPICDSRDERQGKGWGQGNAAADNERAYETVNPPIRGAFSQTLMEGLRNSRDASGVLSIAGLKTYVEDNIGKATVTGQSPQFRCEPESPSMIIVAGGGPPRAGPTVRFKGLAPGTRILLRDGNNRLVPGIGPLAAGPGPVVLPPLADGLYSLAADDGSGRERLFRYPKESDVEVF